MRWFRRITVCCFAAIILGCGGIGGRLHDERLVGDIGLFAIDTREEMSVVDFDSCRALVPATVYAVGWDQSHFIAKRHPTEWSKPVNRSQTEYYIVVVRDKTVHGPFDWTEFVIHCDLLDVSPNLDFTQVFRDLE